MPNQFDQSSIQQYGGVEWAKQQIEALDPSAIQSQIDGYKQVSTSLNQIVQTLNTSNASLQSAWQGDAATAATQSFTETSNHAQNVVTTVTNTITQLNQAKTAAETAQASMSKVPNEKTVPSGNWFTDGVSDLFTGTDPVKQAQQHNTAARTQAADVLNQLSSSYDNAATNLTSISGTSEGGGFTPTGPSTTPSSYNLGAGSYGGGTGAARGYNSSTGTAHAGSAPTVNNRSGGVTNGVFEDGTSIAGLAPFPTETVIPGPETGPTTNPVGTPTDPIFGVGGPIAEPIGQSGIGGIGEPGGMFGDGGAEGPNNLSGRSKLGSSNVFGEEGFGEGGSTAGRSSGLGGSPAAEGEGVGAGAAGEGQGQSGMRGMGGGRRGAGGGAGEEEELGSSKYSRGRYFGGEEPGSGREEWVQPSVGGDESLIVRNGPRGSGTGRVTSAYDGATDADGNPLGRRMGFGGRRAGSSDEDEERGERPAYLKEDPEWWKSAQKVAPPVIE